MPKVETRLRQQIMSLSEAQNVFLNKTGAKSPLIISPSFLTLFVVSRRLQFTGRQ